MKLIKAFFLFEGSFPIFHHLFGYFLIVHRSFSPLNSLFTIQNQLENLTKP